MYSSVHMAMGCLLLCCSVARADSTYLYGIHWWGYSGLPVDTTPATLLDAPAYGGWDLETIITNSADSWKANTFIGLYQDLYSNKNIAIISRVDYNWGETVPSPTNPDYAGWPNSVVSTVNTLRHGCHIWVVGNEPNLTIEANNWPSNHITPSGYATIYRNVRNAIRNNAQASPAGSHLVLIAPPSPGGAAGVRWIDGNQWLGQVIDNIPAAEIDGFALHAYGGSVTDFHNGYSSQLALIDSKNLKDRPVYITEWNRFSTPGNSTEEAAAAQFCRDALADLNTWNQGLGNHNVICICWFVYDANNQAGGGWNGYSIEYWKDNGNPSGSASDLYTAYQQTVDLRYRAGITGTNLARSATQVAVDSQNLGNQGGSKAIDGVLSNSKWTSAGTSPPHWLTLDLGGLKPVNGYFVRHAGAGGEITSFNTQLFQIQSSTSLNGPWTDEFVVDNTAQANVTQLPYSVPKTLRYVRLYITDPGIDNYARIPEFEVWGVSTVTAAFQGTPVSGYVPLTVNFTDQSTGTITSRTWSFGDGGSSTSQNPSHAYIQSGQYDVTLAVSGPNGSDQQTKAAYITVLPLPGDLDDDTDSDQTDFGRFQACYTGQSVPQTDPACASAKLDADADVDLADFAIFQRCFKGVGMIIDPACING